MKISKIHKSTTSNSHSSKPFFTKSGEGSFFSQSKETEKPFFSPCSIQAKLTVGQPNDKYEKEADMTAEKVVRKLETPNSSLPIQRKCEKCDQEERLQKKEENMEEMRVMQKPIFESTEDSRIQTKSIENQLNNSKGKGKPLAKDVRSNMESAFGNDFSKVKIHTDSPAIQMNKELGAKAFTHGKNIFFNKEQYNPESSDGRKLLAHELTHVIQQNGTKKNGQIKNPKKELSLKKNMADFIQCQEDDSETCSKDSMKFWRKEHGKQQNAFLKALKLQSFYRKEYENLTGLQKAVAARYYTLATENANNISQEMHKAWRDYKEEWTKCSPRETENEEEAIPIGITGAVDPEHTQAGVDQVVQDWRDETRAGVGKIGGYSKAMREFIGCFGKCVVVGFADDAVIVTGALGSKKFRTWAKTDKGKRILVKLGKAGLGAAAIYCAYKCSQE